MQRCRDTKYTKELLAAAVKESTSLRQVVSRVGAPLTSGGAHAWIKRLVRRFNLDTSHFLGRLSSLGSVPKNKRAWQEILVLGDVNGRRESSHRLRRALVESGVPYLCVLCGQGDVWNKAPLTLQVDHLNACPTDNRRENLRFLCPNCHTQTANWGNRAAEIEAVKRSRPVRSTKIQWPADDALALMIEQTNTLQVSKKLGVSFNAVKKRITRIRGRGEI